MRRIIRQLNLLSKDESGAVLILIACLMVVLMGMAALAIDGGRLYQTRRQMVNTADAAALAGAQELMHDPNNVGSMVNHYAITLNHADESQVLEQTSNSVTVKTSKNVEFTFARFVGFIQPANVSATATAVIGPLAEMGGLIPIGLQENIFWDLIASNNNNYDYITFENFETIGSGNWGWVNLSGNHGGENMHDQIDNVQYGYPETKYVGDLIWSDTGNNLGSGGAINQHGLGDVLDDYIDNETVLYIPILDYKTSQGQSEQFEIVGFAAIILTGYNPSTNSFTISGILNPEGEHLLEGSIDTSAEDFGLRSITLKD